jgi:hypothetical protein
MCLLCETARKSRQRLAGAVGAMPGPAPRFAARPVLLPVPPAAFAPQQIKAE